MNLPRLVSRRKVLGGLGAAFGMRNATAQISKPNLGAEDTTYPPISLPNGGVIPLIHTTDLYNPPQDVDDQIDLATIYALSELDLQAVILDPTRKFLDKLEPGFVPVAQLNYLTGRAVPVAAGPIDPLQSPSDPADNRPLQEQAGIQLLLDTLSRCERPAMISVLGSSRVLAAAWNRDPDLLRKKTRAVLLNAGSYTGEPGPDWNTDLDVHAWVALWRSGLPIHWYPCSGKQGSRGIEQHNTFWPVRHRVLFEGLSQPLRGYLDYALTASSRGDIIRALAEMGSGDSWDLMMERGRNMWSTASLTMAAGRVLAQTAEGWRFLPQAQAQGLKLQRMELMSVVCKTSDDGVVKWNPDPQSETARIFRRELDEEHVRAMGEATNALLKQFPLK